MITGTRTHHATCPCGWEGFYTTTGYARKARNRHTCGDYAPRECPRHHAHGTPAHYKHCGCRCWPCRLALLDQFNACQRARAYGRQRLVDAGPAREHVVRLLAAGMGERRICAASGVERSVLNRLVRGKIRKGQRHISRRITRATEAALLGVAYDPADGGPGIDADPTIRRMRALYADGWTTTALAVESGWHVSYVDRLLQGSTRRGSGRVRPGTARRAHALYRRLTAQPRPMGVYADRARRRARERGWAPPVRVGGRVLAGQALEHEEAA